MAKQGQHHDAAVDPQHPRGHEDSCGNNNPKKSVKMDVGQAKKSGASKGG
jgi:hypothetical protein